MRWAPQGSKRVNRFPSVFSKIEPPTVDVILLPDPYWAKLRHTVYAEKFEAEDWINAKVVAVYMPVPFDDRLRALTELQQTDPNHNYDENVDFNAMIFLRKRKPARGEEERAVIEEVWVWFGILLSCP